MHNEKDVIYGNEEDVHFLFKFLLMKWEKVQKYPSVIPDIPLTSKTVFRSKKAPIETHEKKDKEENREKRGGKRGGKRENKEERKERGEWVSFAMCTPYR